MGIAAGAEQEVLGCVLKPHVFANIPAKSPSSVYDHPADHGARQGQLLPPVVTPVHGRFDISASMIMFE
jgi:hypothetical protein